MSRTGNEQIGIRLEPEVMKILRERLARERGRAGGMSLLLRRIIYRELGLAMPTQYGRGPVDPTQGESAQERIDAWARTADIADVRAAAEHLARHLDMVLVPRKEFDHLKGRLAQLEAREEADAKPQTPDETPATFPWVKGTQYADPSWLRSSAFNWMRRLRDNPEDRDAAEQLRWIQAIAKQEGVELPDPPKPRRTRTRKKPIS